MEAPTTWIQGNLLDLAPRQASWTAPTLEAHLRTVTRRPVTIRVTKNRVSLISFKFHPTGAIAIRMRKEFLEAPGPVIQAIRTYCTTRRTNAWETINNYAQTMVAATPQVEQSVSPIRTKGKVHDLKTLHDDVNRRFFNNQLRTRITWGRETNRRRLRSRSITFGTYCRDINLVRINPRLDREDVPEEFVRYIIFHELLHAAVPSFRKNGRWTHHSESFRKLERQYPGYPEMQVLASQLLQRI